MIKEVTLINYKNEVLKVYIDDRILYVSVKDSVKDIAKDVLGFDLKLKEESILISYYDKTYSIYIAEIKLNFNKELEMKKCLVITTGKTVKRIDYLTLIITKENNIILVFRGKDKNSDLSYILTSYNLSNNINIVATSDSKSYNTPFISYSYEDKDFLFITEKYSEGKYIVYDLIENRKITTLHLPNITNISFIKFKNKPIIFYNKIDDIDILLKLRDLDTDSKSRILNEEISVSLPNNIFKPQVSIYNEAVYIVWIKENIRYTAISKDLISWSIKENKILDGYFVKANILKENLGHLENIKTYLNSNAIKIYKFETINNKNKYNNRKAELNNSILYSEIIKNKFDRLNDLVGIDEKYSKQYIESLKKIEELEKIIEEKDRFIINLLDIK